MDNYFPSSFYATASLWLSLELLLWQITKNRCLNFVGFRIALHKKLRSKNFVKAINEAS